MNTPHRRPEPPLQHLQRIRPGLPVRVRETPDGRLEIRSQNDGVLVASIPLAGDRSSCCMETFDGTLELFEGSRRLTEAEHRSLAGDSARLMHLPHKRLVLNHTEVGDPLLDPGWTSEALSIVRRPTIRCRLNDRMCRLLRSVGGAEVRILTPRPNGGWDRSAADAASVERTESEGPPEDRYRLLCRSIPRVRRSVGGFSGDRVSHDLQKSLSQFSLGPKH